MTKNRSMVIPTVFFFLFLSLIIPVIAAETIYLPYHQNVTLRGDSIEYSSDQINPPVYIEYQVTPLWEGSTVFVCDDDPFYHNYVPEKECLYGHFEPTQRPSKKSWFLVTVRKAGSSEILIQEGFGNTYDTNTKRTLKILASGPYKIALSGNYVTVDFRVWSSDSNPGLGTATSQIITSTVFPTSVPDNSLEQLSSTGTSSPRLVTPSPTTVAINGDQKNYNLTLLILAIFTVFILGAGGFFIIRSRRSDGILSEEKQEQKSETGPKPGIPAPQEIPCIITPLDRISPPFPDPFLSRFAAVEKKAQAITAFRTPIDNLLFLSREYHSTEKQTEAENVLKNAEAAIPTLRQCESQYSQWKNQGYDTTSLEIMRTEGVKQIQSAFREFKERVDKLDRVQSGLEELKREYPSIITLPEFRSGITTIGQYLKKPDSVTLARLEFERLSSNIKQSAQEKERIEHHLYSQIARIQQSVSDESVLNETNRIFKTLQSGDHQSSEQLLRELTSRQATRLNDTLASLREEGAVILDSILPIQRNDEDREYGDRIIEATTNLEELGRIKEQFREASALKGVVTDSRLLDLYHSGNYEAFITEYENQINLEKTGGLIFISAKSEDYQYAHQVYAFLIKNGYNVFFSQETLPILGKSEFGDEIDTAIEKARHLIVVTSNKDYVRSKWVKSEWRMFLDEKRAGRKPGNIITIIAGSMQIEDLPIGLRNYETKFMDDPHTLEQILYYLT